MRIKRIVIVGNDDVAWLAADMLSRHVEPGFADVDLLIPDEAPSIWATLARGATLTPDALAICDAFGWGELTLLAATRGGLTTGSVVSGFAPGRPGFVTFGAIGEPLHGIGFHHLVARRRLADRELPLTAFMGGALCAQASRFTPPPIADQFGQAAFNHGLQIDAARIATTASAAAVSRGVRFSAGAVALVERDERGRITSIITDRGSIIEGDLFVDCANWLEDEPAVVDWGHWLPCDRIASKAREDAAPPAISTHLAAHPAGWQRQRALPNVMIDSFAYCDAVPGDRPTGAVAFRSGRCEVPWRTNCVSIGDGAVILDPINEMRLPLAMAAIARLAELLPSNEDQRIEAREYNRQTIAELDHARDFAIAPYCLNARRGDPFWDQCRTIEPPDSLAARIQLYRRCGRVAEGDDALHSTSEWIAQFDALGLRPQRHDSLVDILPDRAVDDHLQQVRQRLVERVGAMAPYLDTLRRLERVI